MSRLRSTRDETASRLPEDPTIADLDPALRERVGKQWASRATAELRVAGVFTIVAHDLLAQGGDPTVLAIAARAVSDEVRHADLCRMAAERYLGRPVPWPSPGRSTVPSLAGAPPRLRGTLHTIAMGCINETIASSWLDECLRPTTSPLARAVIRELVADDVHHARLGWGHLASSFVDREARQTLGGWLPKLLEYAAKPWTRAAEDKIVEGIPTHGVPSAETTRVVVGATLEDVVLPGFEALGVPTRAAREWTLRHFEPAARPARLEGTRGSASHG